MKTIVVGYDGSEASDAALDRVAELAPLLQAKVIVTSVEMPVVTNGGLVPAPAISVDLELHEREHRERERLLAHAQSYLAERGIAAEVAAAVGPPVDEIIAVAEQHDADLIVVGTHEPGFLERLLRGSVSQGVARRARCDVLVVHPREKGKE
ncbi:MAG: universal stress protein [Actinobacteria bacterium]|nr:universal stress protein [Actinomycetota bacterium]